MPLTPLAVLPVAAPAEVLDGAAPAGPIGAIELGIALGFLGAFFLCFLAFARVFPGVLPAGSRQTQ